VALELLEDEMAVASEGEERWHVRAVLCPGPGSDGDVQWEALPLSDSEDLLPFSKFASMLLDQD